MNVCTLPTIFAIGTLSLSAFLDYLRKYIAWMVGGFIGVIFGVIYGAMVEELFGPLSTLITKERRSENRKESPDLNPLFDGAFTGILSGILGAIIAARGGRFTGGLLGRSLAGGWGRLTGKEWGGSVSAIVGGALSGFIGGVSGGFLGGLFAALLSGMPVFDKGQYLPEKSRWTQVMFGGVGRVVFEAIVSGAIALVIGGPTGLLFGMTSSLIAVPIGSVLFFGNFSPLVSVIVGLLLGIVIARTVFPKYQVIVGLLGVVVAIGIAAILLSIVSSLSVSVGGLIFSAILGVFMGKVCLTD
ncbi:MAG: hypothetical protein GWO20_18530 [Candidatus Korarchaeota archaeon]|nr:hypothetical protein [Candidatus Korarchaeota archaeon]NIU85289.1 hypothetical protein [Candidatus Thorarchaeota archaeon]NIW15387.1 hypothetical protein [Candidatus Thorarchaeota archaeon]NIW53333.1 hypothetical protein [Candidatus Korarchaeota archaeon]